jgi:hypothetical protein
MRTLLDKWWSGIDFRRRDANLPKVDGDGARPVRQGPPPTGESTMKLRTALFVAALFASGGALAFHCPADMAKIDAALAKSPPLTQAQLDEVKKLRADGEALHKAGKHQESVDTLAKAMKILNIS